ncbi:MAG: N-acetylmuramoyl-L-alanine amidase family protein [Verrucomicrobiia bacterium]
MASGCTSSPEKRVSAVTPLPQKTAELYPETVLTRQRVTNKLDVVEKQQPVAPQSIIATNAVAAKPQTTLSQIDNLTNQLLSVSYEKNGFSAQCVVRNEGRVLTIYNDRQYINYNGVKIDLGYIPRWENGRCYLSEAEIQSTILPLLKPPVRYDPKTTVIVVDPGHGGSDPGTVSLYNNKPEKTYTLDIAQRLYSLLTSSGWSVILTRTNDARVERASRVAISEKSGATIFISIHLNYFEKSKNVSGIETYCLPPAGLPSGFNRGFSDNINNIYPNNSYDRQNILLAARVQSALVKNLNASDRGVRRARFLEVLQNQKCAAVLVEAGFLSNLKESALIDSSQYRQTIAESIYEGITRFCGRD